MAEETGGEGVSIRGRRVIEMDMTDREVQVPVASPVTSRRDSNVYMLQVICGLAWRLSASE